MLQDGSYTVSCKGCSVPCAKKRVWLTFWGWNRKGSINGHYLPSIRGVDPFKEGRFRGTLGWPCHFSDRSVASWNTRWPRIRRQATTSDIDGYLESLFRPHISQAIGQDSSNRDGRRCIQFHSSGRKSNHPGSMGERHARNGLHDLFRGRRCQSSRALVEEGRKGYRSDVGARGNPGRLCDPAVNEECPLLVGDH